jgi:hypothetical protein
VPQNQENKMPTLDLSTLLDRACGELVDKDTEIARLRTALEAIKAICQTPQHQRRLYHVELIAVTTLGK